MKPPYRVPSMEEIKNIPPNGFKSVSTFSGCGGSSLGYKMAGFQMMWANEFVPRAQEVYRLNHPTTILETRDIREITGKDILDATGLKVGEIDLFDGSPPCASFSTAGARDRLWGVEKKYSTAEGKQRTDDLFYEYARLLEETKPKTFVAENVSGLVKGTAKGYFQEILKRLKACGYNVKAKLLSAQWLGVPQMRERLIFVGVREDLGMEPAFPKPLPYDYSMIDACPWMRGEDDPPEAVEKEAWFIGYSLEPKWRALKPGQTATSPFLLYRPDPYRACPTITANTGNTGAASPTHPYLPRKFSTLECKRLCGFPDDFQLVGKYIEQIERLGRAVPPVMMAAIASAVRDEILIPLRAKGVI